MEKFIKKRRQSSKEKNNLKKQNASARTMSGRRSNGNYGVS